MPYVFLCAWRLDPQCGINNVQYAFAYYAVAISVYVHGGNNDNVPFTYAVYNSFVMVW